ncbi:MAG: 30S ribosomal protein S3 [Candidatus Brocadiia bacterium]
MGQKVSPVGFRIGITKDWVSRWYATKKDYGNLIIEDARIRKFVKKQYGFSGIDKVEIDRTKEKVIVTIYSAKPGLIIGRRGSRVDELGKELMGLAKSPIDLKVVEIAKPELSAQIVSESIGQQLEKRAAYRRVVRKSAETVMAAGALGVKIRLSGRIGGVEIARAEKINIGKVPLHTLRADIDFGRATAIITKGTIGIKVWIYKGEIIRAKAKKDITNVVNAQTDKVPQVAPGQA